MQIYYFTRSGRSRKIAEELAAKYEMEARSVDDGINWNGPIGYGKAGFYAVMKKSVPIKYLQPDQADNLVVVFPVWAGALPPAIRTFVKEAGVERIIAVPTSLGSALKERDGFIKVIDLIGKEIAAPEKL